MSITVTLNTDGPREPGYLLKVAEAGEQAVRVMNHITRDHAALQYPAEADRLLRHLESAAAGYRQLFSQVTGWLETEQETGRIKVSNQPPGAAAVAVAEVRARLNAAKWAAETMRAALDDAASVTSTLAAAEPQERK